MLSEGGLRLMDFKNLLAKHGYESEFRGQGVLLCNGGVAVRKLEGQRLVVDGPLCDEYYEVRRLLYEQFVIL